jgi:hypothetical protein
MILESETNDRVLESKLTWVRPAMLSVPWTTGAWSVWQPVKYSNDTVLIFLIEYGVRKGLSAVYPVSFLDAFDSENLIYSF